MPVFAVKLQFDGLIHVEAHDEDDAREVAERVVWDDENGAFDPDVASVHAATPDELIEHSVDECDIHGCTPPNGGIPEWKHP